MFKRYIHTITPLAVVSGLMLGGCANKQVWSPALEDARNTYQQVSQDPVVSSLAQEELRAAHRQLSRAESASAEFRKQQSIDHEAKLAKIKILVAQQRARALSANHSLQLALGQQPLLAEEKILAATVAPVAEPTMAAAISMGGQADVSDLAAQLAAVSAQLAALQAQIANNSAVTEIPASQIIQQEAQQLPGPVPPIETTANEVISEEPELSAALPSAAVRGKVLPTQAQLKRQLLAINAKPAQQGMALTLGERYFETGSARLWSNRAARHLDNVASILSTNPDLTLDIEAHTDNTASADASYDLSVGRAVSIKSALVLRGVDESRINAQGYGYSRPITNNKSPLGRLQNRRIDLIFPNVQL